MSINAMTTRRSFVAGTAAAGVAAVAAIGSISIDRPAFADEVTWNKEADLVVVGAGTGLAGALAGAVNDLSVLQLESRAARGGAMAFSGGCAWLPNNVYSQETGDSYEKAYTYLKHMQMEYTNFEVMEAFLDNTQVTLDTFAKGGVALAPMSNGIEYHPDWEGAHTAGGRTFCFLDEGSYSPTASCGWRLAEYLWDACDNMGVECMLETTGKRLVTTREGSDSVPEVLGIIAEDANGNEIAIKANKGVLLATGGFEYDEELVTNFVRVPIRASASWATNTGQGLRMAMSVGAELAMMNEFWGHAVYTKQAELSRANGEPMCLGCHLERSLPGSILIDANARRYCNEASDYDSQGNTMGGYNNYFDNGWTCDNSWLVFDNVCYETYHPNGGESTDNGFPTPDIPEEELIVVGDTIEELAEKIGVPGEVLVDTIEQFNKYAHEDRDPIFHRGETTRPLTPVQQTMAPLEEGPYRAMQVSSGCLGTIGGPRLNKHAQVMHVSGEPIKGLYAMGNCAGVGAPGPTYGGGGGTVGPAFVMGVIAARHAAGVDVD